MKYTGVTYRPPFEASSLLLQVTQGCSHNRCSFCTMYRDVPFQIEDLKQIEKDLDEANLYYPYVKRVFLENGDPLVLSAAQLKAIAKLIHQKLPYVETIAMYAFINNIKTKTDDELKELRQLGINELNIGVESGLDEALKHMEKGYTSDEAIYELLRLKKAGIDFGANIIFGMAGPKLRRENAIKTAKLINQTKPYLIFTGTLHADQGCPLYEELHAGTFQESTIGEYMEEEEILLEHLNITNCYYFGLHPSNVVRMQGFLSEDKEKLLAHLRQQRSHLTKEQLSTIAKRVQEGSIVM